jgi:hypothetical protein
MQDLFDKTYTEYQQRVAYNLEKQVEDKIREIVRDEIIKTKTVQTVVASDFSKDTGVETTVTMEKWANGTYFVKDCSSVCVEDQKTAAYLKGYCEGFRQGKK